MNNEHQTTNRTTLLTSLLCYLLLSSWALADVPHLIRYQGQAVDSQGIPLEEKPVPC